MYSRTAWTSSEDLRDRLLNGGFYQSIRLTLLSSRLFGLLPISGLWNKSGESTRYTWKSLYSLIYFPNLVLQVFFLLYHVMDFGESRISTPKLNSFSFLCSYIFGCISLLRLSRNWRPMITDIEALEKKLPPVKNPRRAVRVANLIMFAVQISSIIDYLLFMAFTIKMTRECYLRSDDSGLYLKSYFLGNYSWFYAKFPFSYYTMIFLQIVPIQSALILNCVMSTVAITSIYLTDKFKIFNKILLQQKTRNRLSWIELQIYYTKLSRLVRVVNTNFHPFVFITFWTNLYYISQQTFYTLNKLTRTNLISYNTCFESHKLDWIILVFFSYSFILATLRLVMLWYLTAELNTTSRKPLDILYTVPSRMYGVELQRLLTQIYRSRVCFSGLNLFWITRGTLLTMIATVFTYELVLLQI